MLSSSVGVKSCSPATGTRTSTRSPEASGAIPKPCATPSTPSTNGGSRRRFREARKRPHTIHRAFDPERAAALRELLHKSPREFGKQSSLWTMEMAAEVSFEEGLTKERVSGETIRATLSRMGVRWERARRWITSPDPQYARKKDGATG